MIIYVVYWNKSKETIVWATQERWIIFDFIYIDDVSNASIYSANDWFCFCFFVSVAQKFIPKNQISRTGRWCWWFYSWHNALAWCWHRTIYPLLYSVHVKENQIMERSKAILWAKAFQTFEIDLWRCQRYRFDGRSTSRETMQKFNRQNWQLHYGRAILSI